VFGYKFGQRIVVSPKPATCVTSAGGDVNAKIGGSPPSRCAPAVEAGTVDGQITRNGE